MASSFDKPLYSSPATMAAAQTQAEEPIDVQLESDEDEDQEDIVEEPEESPEFVANLADEIDEGVLQSLGMELSSDIDNDRQSRKEWEKTYVMGLKLMGLQYEERTEPWMGASGVFHPMITEAVVRFQSETITEMFPAQGPVRTTIWGKETPEKKQAATNVEEDMNYELVEKMPEFRPEMERMLWSLPAAGSAFKKVYKDPSLGRQVSMFIPAEDVILPYGTTDQRMAPRVTHQMRMHKNDILKLIATGFYRDVDLPDPSKQTDEIQKAKDQETGFNDINDDRYTLYESLVDLDLDGYNDVDENNDETGIALPYVVTVIKGTGTVLSIRRNWRENDPLKLKRQHFVHYQYIPGF